MNDWGDEDVRNSPGSLLLLMGVALGTAAALLLSTKPGQQVRRQIVGRAGDWTAQAADALAQGREKLIAAVEQQSEPASGPVREKPL